MADGWLMTLLTPSQDARPTARPESPFALRYLSK